MVAKIGAKMMMNSGLKDCTCEGSSSVQKKSRFARWSVYSATTVNWDWKMAKNATEPASSGM